MNTRGRTYAFLAATALVWILVMGLVFHANYDKKDEVSPDSLSSDVTVNGETRQFFNVFREGAKAGYMITSQISLKGLRVLREEVVLKVNLSGISREIFIRSTAGIDSASGVMKYLDYRTQSGSHTYLFNAAIHGDSLLINVKSNDETPWRRGMFTVDDQIIPLVALPFIMHHSSSRELRVQVFDPLVFAPYAMTITRGAGERLKIAGVERNLRRYDMELRGKRSSAWLDSLGRMVRAEGMTLYGDALGGFTVEQEKKRDVFLLPIETSLGRDTLDKLVLSPGKDIENPRSVRYMEIELDGVRAAGVDVDAPNKEVLSVNPVVLGIHDAPVADGDRLNRMRVTMRNDTSLVGTSDYIQCRDARIVRTARGIVTAGADTLAMARAINRWVYSNMKRDEEVSIARSADVLRALRGGRDEYTKLFVALSRSIGILTRIHIGLVYEDGVFRYHSWPSVFDGDSWRDLDPWYGQDTADATHVSLVCGDFERLSELLKLINVLSLKVHTYR